MGFKMFHVRSCATSTCVGCYELASKNFLGSRYRFSHPGFLKLVEEEWRNMGNLDLVDRLTKIYNSYTQKKKWNKEVFGNIDFRISTL